MDTPFGAQFSGISLLGCGCVPCRAALSIKFNPLKPYTMNEVQLSIEDRIRTIVRETVLAAIRESIPNILESFLSLSTGSHPQLYTKEEVCAKMDICPATYHNWINSGKISEYKIRGRVYVDARTIDEALENGTIAKGHKKKSCGEDSQSQTLKND